MEESISSGRPESVQLTQEILDDLLLPRLTPEQQKAVTARGGSLLLSASAGSGKTSVLTDRVISKITDRTHPVDADRMLIVTFSRAAAEEMRQRIAQKIHHLLSLYPDDRILLRQQLLLHKAPISTIDSFCHTLVRAHFNELGISPDFRVAEEMELTDLQEKAMNDILSQYYEEGDPVFLSLADYFSRRDDSALIAAIQRIYTAIRSFPFPFTWLEQKQQLYRPENVENSPFIQLILEEAKQALQEALSLNDLALTLAAEDPVMYQAYADALVSDRKQLENLLEKAVRRDWDHLNFALQTQEFIRLGALKKYPDTQRQERVKSLREDVKNLIGKLRDEYISCPLDIVEEEIAAQEPFISCLFELVKAYSGRLDEYKQEKNLLDFADLEHLAIKLLIHETENGYQRTELCQALSDNFDEILIDEFQDTNKTQELLFHALSRDETNLFMVGDVKQSIYSFRQAMPEIFIEKRARFSDFDTGLFPARLSLVKNFRSRYQVTASVNFFFRQLMGESFGGVNYDSSEELVAHDSYPPNERADTEIHLIESDGDAETDSTTLEARHIGQEIRRMLEERFPVSDGQGGMRPCTPGDFAILLRTTKGQSDLYVRELARQGIDVWCDRTTSYFDSREIVIMLNLLRVIDNPLLDIPLLSVLMSPMFFFSAEEIAEIRLVKPDVPLYICLSIQAKENTKCADFVTLLEKLRRESICQPVAKLIRMIYDDTLFAAIVGAMESGARKRANLRLLLTYAEKYEAAGYKGLSGFIRFVDRAMEGGGDFESANSVSASGQSVRIMSIHRSKGLEFPICFIAGCCRKFNLQDLNGELLIEPELGVSLMIKNRETMQKYRSVPLCASRIRARQTALSESMRVLYVAMTRAREKLILTMCGDHWTDKLCKLAQSLPETIPFRPYTVGQASSTADWILAAALRNPSAALLRSMAGITDAVSLDEKKMGCHAVCSLQIQYIPCAHTAEEASVASISAMQPDPKDLQRLQKQIDWVYPYTAATKIPSKFSVTQLAHRSSVPDPAAGKVQSNLTSRQISVSNRSAGLSPAERGTALHTFMQFVNFHAALKDLPKELQRLTEQALEEAASINLNLIQNFLHSGLMQRIFAAEKTIREFKFMDEIPASALFPDGPENESILIQGIADMVLVEKNGIVIIDYKTDRVSSPDILIQRYADQLAYYKHALSKVFEQPVTDCILYSLHLSIEVPVPLK